MSDQAQAVEPSLDDRIGAAIEAELYPQEAPEEPVEQAEPVESEEVPEVEAEEVEEQPEEFNWDEYKDIKVKVPLKNGEEMTEAELSLEELRLGHMRQADYQRKTQEVAKQREEIQQQFQQAILQEQAKFVQQLRAQEAFLVQLAAPELQQVDWNRLAQEDPAEFVRLNHRAAQINQARQHVAQQIQQAEQQRLAVTQQQVAQAIAQAEQQLATDIPNWTPETKQALRQTGIEYGFTDEELGNVIDPRHIKVLHDAYQWRQLQKQKPIAEKKVVELPKVLKPGKKAPVSQGNKLAELRARVKKSGGKDESALDDLIKSALR